MPAQSCRRWLKPFSDHSSFLILSGLISVGIYNLQGHKAEPVCPGAEFSLIWPSLPSGKAVEIFSAIRMRKKYYRLSGYLDRACLAGYNPAGDGRTYLSALFRSRPARRRDYSSTGQTCPVKVCRGKAVKQQYPLYPRLIRPSSSEWILDSDRLAHKSNLRHTPKCNCKRASCMKLHSGRYRPLEIV
jgi:hypothetical protein